MPPWRGAATPPLTAMATVFVGDVHGCAAELEELLNAVGFVNGRDRLLLTGDAFSRGPEPERVWAILRTAGAGMVLGNHDDRLLRQLRAAAAGEAVRFRRPHHATTFERLLPLADELLPWLESLPLCICGETTAESARQAGLPPKPDQGVACHGAPGQSARQGGLPPKDKAVHKDGFVLVHAGISPERGLAGTRRQEFLTIRTWPPGHGLEGPRWHRHLEPLPATLVFGHDAPGGLTVDRLSGRRRPWLVGLDSGCVYGGCLSAWLFETDRLVQVPSRQPRP